MHNFQSNFTTLKTHAKQSIKHFEIFDIIELKPGKICHKKVDEN